MNLFLDSFWRAAAYCLHPRVILLSLLPLVIMAVLALGLGYFYWYPALEWVRTLLESSEIFNQVWVWLEGIGAGKVKVVAGPLIVIFAVTPIIIVTALLLVAVMMSPALVALVARNRFPLLVRKREASLLLSLLWSLGSTALALIALLVSSPLWLVPPLILVLPPLIWGWLTYRVMAFDALSEHASKAERRTLFLRHRGWLLAIGIVTGFMGAAPSIVWASGMVFATMFAILVPVAIWIYTLVFAFASLWFAHFCLAALQALRNQQVEELTLVPIAQPAPEAVALVHDTGDHHTPAP